VRVTYDYYPYGLAWEDPKLPSSPEAIHDHCYQDKEFQFGEFSTGHGLALYDFHARMYDPATGRWLVPDPAAQFANPYLAMGNNPVVGVDPDGRFVVSAMIVGAVVGAYIGGSMANDNMNPFQWDYQNPNTWIGIGVGGAIGAFGGHSFAAAKGSAMCIGGKSMTATTGKKMFGATVGGVINTISNYDGADDFGWGTLGDFAAGFGGSYVGLNAQSSLIGFVAGGTLNVGSQYYQNGQEMSGYEAAQAFVGGGLSAMGGMSYGGYKSAWLNVENKGARMTNKFLHYGTQSTAYDFAYSKEKDFMNRPMHDRFSMFLFSGIGGAVSSEGFSGKLMKGNVGDNAQRSFDMKNK
jgi:RHS repeat-associated protein